MEKINKTSSNSCVEGIGCSSFIDGKCLEHPELGCDGCASEADATLLAMGISVE